MVKKRGAIAFANFSQSFLETFLDFTPEFGTIWGIDGFDHRSCDFTLKGMKAENAAYEKAYKELIKIDKRKLSKSQSLDYQVLKAQLEIDLYDMNHSENRAIISPQDYLGFEGIDYLMDRNVRNLPKKTLSRLRYIPQTFKVAKKHIKDEIKYQPMEWVRTAIEACQDGKIFLKDILKHPKIRHSELYDAIGEATNIAEESREDYEEFLKEILPKVQGNFAVGKRRFNLTLKKQQFLNLSTDELFQFGINLFDKTKKELEKLVSETGDTIISYDKKQKNKLPPKEKIIDLYIKYKEKAIEFIHENNLAPLEHKEEMKVIKIPSYAVRSYPYVAYSLPPSFGEQIGHTLINISSKENLEEQTYSFIRSTIIHEGYPGHHLQLTLANYQARSRKSGWIRLLNESSTMYEGWAMYCEQLMHEQGFNKNKNDKFTLLKGRLWRALRVQIDIGLQTKGWSYEKTKKLMVDELNFTEEAAATDLNWYIEQPGAPLGYAVGWKMINLLRDYEKDRLGKNFKLYDFHEKLLSQGSIALPLVIKESFGNEALEQVYSEFRREL